MAREQRLQRAWDVSEDGVGVLRGKEEDDDRKMCEPACVQHRKRSCRPERAGSVSGRVVGSREPGARKGSVEPADGFWTTRVSQRGPREKVYP